jgi:very-short-patch-repair endonuclease
VVRAASRCTEAAERFGVKCDGVSSPEEEIRVIVEIARKAPFELLRYRNQNLAQRGVGAEISRARDAIRLEAEMRGELADIFHIDAVPPVNELKAALSAFRRPDGLLNFVKHDWREAKKTFNTVAKQRVKRRAPELAELTARLLAWSEHRDAFLSNKSWSQVFGDLYQGFETETEKVQLLHEWYVESHGALVASANLLGKFSLTTVEADWLEAIAARADELMREVGRMDKCASDLASILGIPVPFFDEARRKGWSEAIRCLEEVHRTLREAANVLDRYAQPHLSPRRALELLEARLKFQAAKREIDTIVGAADALRCAGGVVFKRLFADDDPPLAELLEVVSELTPECEAITKFLGEHADQNTTVAAACGFVISRHALAQVLSNLAAPGSEFTTMDAMVSAAEAVSALSHEIVEIFGKAANPNVSVVEAFDAMAKHAIAEEIIEEIATSSEATKLFGPVLKGYDTDCQAIFDTHAWGREVARSGLPADIRWKLLSRDPIDPLSSCTAFLNGISEAWDEACGAVECLSRYGEVDTEKWAHPASLPSNLVDKNDRALGAPTAIIALSKWLAARADVIRDGLSGVLSILEKGRAHPSAIGPLFELVAYLSIARGIWRETPQLTRFDGKAHTRLREEFKTLDHQIIDLTGKDCAWRIDSAKVVPEGTHGVTVSELTEMKLLRREINKQKRHIPIRQLVLRAGHALQALKPCFMMGPLSVAQYLAQGTLKFDLVIMDEASQLRPEDALGAIARGSQLVVVGDPKQLPPTNFFDKMGDSVDEDDEEATAIIQGMESILDICQQICSPIRSLRWHYRSQHESLIAYSNHYFYKNLVVFPSPHSNNPRLGVKWRFVRDGVYEDRRNFSEAKRIADAVVWHMTTCFDESLGVVTLNGTQRDLVEELLERRFRDSDTCRAYLERWEAEGWPFFVKNLENVQGDERDSILISTTFGKPKGAARVRQNFGPITTRPDGWRRLNVLFTRAKSRLELFTSMQPEDIIVDEKTPLGTKALRDYLEFAKRGILASTDATLRDPDSDFEIAVIGALQAAGYEVRPQLGVAGYFIDIAVRNPDRPGEWLAAVECDGASYHSGLSVRDRDRIRQEILESLGWKGRIYRIWSTDWFNYPQRETAKLLDFLARCRENSLIRLQVDDVVFPWEDEIDEAPTPKKQSDADADENAMQLLQDEAVESPASDIFVEIGDRVTYCFMENPSQKMTVLIVDSASNPRLNIVNENTPLARSLLGLTLGEEGQFVAPGQQPRTIKILKVER